jgi:nitroreductase
MLKNLVQLNRSYRRYNELVRISPATLRELVDLARQTASGRNVQPLKYTLVTSRENCERVFPNLGWAAYLKDWNGPEAGERPSAYLVMLGDTAIASAFGIDPGIAAQTILLGAVEKGLGGCIIATVNRKELMALLDIPERFEILYVLALGKPVEKVVIEPLGASGDIKYWRDEQQVHHVPKRLLEEVIIGEK